MDWEKAARDLADILESQKVYIEYLQATLKASNIHFVYKSPHLRSLQQ